MKYVTRKRREFERVYLEYQDVVYRASMYYTSNDELASEEITQKVFFDLYLHYNGANIEFMHSYLCTAAKNTAFTWLKQHKRLVYVNTNEIWENEFLEVPAAEEEFFRAEQIRVAKELKESILERLRKKNKLWYEAVYLVYCLEIPHRQVAKDLGVHVDVIHSRLYRAGQWVRKKYRQEYDDLLSYTS